MKEGSSGGRNFSQGTGFGKVPAAWMAPSVPREAK